MQDCRSIRWSVLPEVVLLIRSLGLNVVLSFSIWPYLVRAATAILELRSIERDWGLDELERPPGTLTLATVVLAIHSSSFLRPSSSMSLD